MSDSNIRAIPGGFHIQKITDTPNLTFETAKEAVSVAGDRVEHYEFRAIQQGNERFLVLKEQNFSGKFKEFFGIGKVRRQEERDLALAMLAAAMDPVQGDALLKDTTGQLSPRGASLQATRFLYKNRNDINIAADPKLQIPKSMPAFLEVTVEDMKCIASRKNPNASAPLALGAALLDSEEGRARLNERFRQRLDESYSLQTDSHSLGEFIVTQKELKNNKLIDDDRPESVRAFELIAMKVENKRIESYNKTMNADRKKKSQHDDRGYARTTESSSPAHLAKCLGVRCEKIKLAKAEEEKHPADDINDFQTFVEIEKMKAGQLIIQRNGQSHYLQSSEETKDLIWLGNERTNLAADQDKMLEAKDGKTVTAKQSLDEQDEMWRYEVKAWRITFPEPRIDRGVDGPRGTVDLRL